jgi:hypothetical protein
VIVWDTGTYRNLVEEEGEEVPIAAQIEDGHVKVWLEGEKLTGGYVLQRTGSGDDERWFLIKLDDEAADRRRNPISTEPGSVLSGKTNEDLEEADEG